MAKPSKTQLEILREMARGKRLMTQLGRSPSAFLSTLGTEQIIRGIRFNSVFALLEAGLIENTTVEGKRWRGSTYIITQKGRKALND